MYKVLKKKTTPEEAEGRWHQTNISFPNVLCITCQQIEFSPWILALSVLSSPERLEKK
jgi:hypothetical protein